MSNIEKIEGSRILELFRELLQEGTPLKITISDPVYEHLTCIVDLQTIEKNIYFRIQYAQSFENIVLNNAAQPSIEFEFTGKDGVKYLFRTRKSRVLKGRVWLESPQVVEREQRRKQFRISAPSGSKLFFCLDSIKFELNIVDISTGGSLAISEDPPHKTSQNRQLMQLKHLREVELVFPPEDENLRILIHDCEIRRLGRNPVTNQHEYGLSFQGMDNSNARKLNQLVYRFQREFLRKRLRINA
jgi:c-di-GMP-binding flagellar brake protein YcgR